jgi:hypothetical protein
MTLKHYEDAMEVIANVEANEDGEIEVRDIVVALEDAGFILIYVGDEE